MMPDGHGGEIWVYIQTEKHTVPAHTNTGADAIRGSMGNNFSSASHGTLAFDLNSDPAAIKVTPPETRVWETETDYYVNQSGIVYNNITGNHNGSTSHGTLAFDINSDPGTKGVPSKTSAGDTNTDYYVNQSSIVYSVSK
jgi:hypothetical protein